ncbi:hypothetical protein KY304_00470 [Candidatus Woesearchaeota archaeon]|nr:hypothetical protein [Candidatus Woesearchaeota archaeon]
MQLDKFLFGCGIFFLLVLVLSNVSYALIGCCCDPVSLNGTFEDDASCAEKNFIFIGVPPAGQTCSVFCNATQGIPSAVVNITETVGTVGCGVPGFKLPASDFIAESVKGKRKARLSFNLPCPADYVKVFRCSGSDCSDFELIDTVVSGSSYFDESSDLEFGVDYRYKIVAHYSGGSDSRPAFAETNLGDLECWFKTDESEFCISSFYYDKFMNYLKAYGYKSGSRNDFLNNFNSKVDFVFGSRFNKAWSCNDNNVLFQKIGAVSCSDDEICVSSMPRAQCIVPGSCEQGGYFGLFSEKSSCESQPYCFFDRSKTNVDFCFQCSPSMSCVNYNSESACVDDICGVGDCEWSDIYSSIGVGVCIDKRFNNCPLCSQTPVTSIPNSIGFNRVFDVCSLEKALALSTEDDECFFNKNILDAVSCSGAVCADFSKSQCRSPVNGIELGSDNSIVSRSSDSCGIGVCYYSDSDNRCFKDADANKIADCDDRNCEKDFFPPVANVFVLKSAGRDSFLEFNIKDRRFFGDKGVDVTNNVDYLTFVCVGSCEDVNSFALINGSRLNIDNLELKDGQDVITGLSEGRNILSFFTVDPNRNVGVVNSVDFSACENCVGPKILNYVVQANEFEGTYYTNKKNPVFRVVFNEPAEIVSASLFKGSEQVSFSVEPYSDFNYEYVLHPDADLLDGAYVFSLNARDETGLFMDFPLEFNLTVDTVVPSVSLRPEENSFFDAGVVNLSVSCSEKVLLNASVDDIIFVNNYVVSHVFNDIANLLSTDDDRIFSGMVSGLSSGKKSLHVFASDYAGNKVEKESVFFIATGSPDFRLKSPSFGVSSEDLFDVVVESSARADCRYLYDVPVPPPASEFAHLSKFDVSGNTEHVLYGIEIPKDNKSEHLLYVYCKGSDFEPVRKTFELTVDTETPKIITAFVYPEVVSDYISPDDLRFGVELKLQVSEPAFCRYSSVTDVFDDMELKFPGYGESLKVSHVINLTVDEQGNYSYYVGCEDIAELKTSVKKVSFSVDTSIPLKVSSVSDRYQSDGPLALRVETNKHAFCYYGEDEFDVSVCFGDCKFGFSHVAFIEKSEKGDYSFFVKCNNGAGGEISDIIPISIGLGIKEEPVSPTHCENLVLDSTETDVDCGGACPGCALGLNCIEDSDCDKNLFCINRICSKQDSDKDGVADELDECPDTPFGEISDSKGCSKSQRDRDGDGLDDSWELKYGLNPDDPDDANYDLDNDGLSNLEEFNAGTYPDEKDSDNDGWSDGKEVKKGFNPLDSESHPKSYIKTVLFILGIVILIVGAGIGGYFAFRHFGPLLKKKLQKKPKAIRPVKPVARPKYNDFKGLRKMVKIGPPRPAKEPGWVSFDNFVERIKKKAPPDVWEKMRRIKQVPVKKSRPLVRKSQEEVLSSLRKIAKKRKK